MEGHWETVKGAPLILFAVPDEAAEANRWQVSVPKLGSLILTHDWSGEVAGLKASPAAARPPVVIVFFAFRIMVGLGLLMIALAAIGTWLHRGDRLYRLGGICGCARPRFPPASSPSSPAGW
jgi:cytochrome d ubiquinol oxidase subunit I